MKIEKVKDAGKKIELQRIEEQKKNIDEQKAREQEYKQNIENQINELRKQVEAKKASRLAQATKSVAGRVVPTARASGGTNDAKMYIYMHESGNNPARWNSSGCVGLGQACPASKLLAVCPDLSDYACQDAWFTNYANQRYGGWNGAYQFWLAHHWW